MREREQFTAWITKYALTIGIEEKLVEDCFETSQTMVKDVNAKYGCFYHGKDWHRTKTDAIKRAKVMQAEKLKSIDKQKASIAALKFE